MPSIPKISEPFRTFIELLLVLIFYAELKVEVSYMLVLFDELILLKLWCMVDSMVADDLFCKLEMDAFILSE